MVEINKKIEQCREHFIPNPNASKDYKVGFRDAVASFKKFSPGKLRQNLSEHQKNAYNYDISDSKRQYSIGYSAGLGSIGVTAVANKYGIDPKMKECFSYLESGILDSQGKNTFRLGVARYFGKVTTWGDYGMNAGVSTLTNNGKPTKCTIR
jgi:hypothetical protein